MKTKHFFPSEAAYAVGILTLALGTALMARADFGMSMVVAPAYLLHRRLSVLLPWFSFGIAEYCLQAFLLAVTAIALRRFRLYYLLSFCTAMIYGVTLDAMVTLVSGIPGAGMFARVLFFATGALLCTLGVAFFFHTDLAPEAYELLVKEISSRFCLDVGKAKLVYDCTSCAVSVVMSFLFFGFGHFEGIGWGTLVCALANGPIIGVLSRMLDQYFRFDAVLPRSKMLA